MKLLIASDLHGSAVYTAQLLERFAEEKADRLVLLGDILYHGPRNDLPDGYAPKEVIRLLTPLAQKILCVRGNCDAEVDQMVLPFPLLQESALIFDGSATMFLTHGHIFNEQRIPPICPGDIVLYGHTHVPVMHCAEGRVFINPGSVSIPKDGSTRGYIIYEERRFTRRALDGQTERVFIPSEEALQ